VVDGTWSRCKGGLLALALALACCAVTAMAPAQAASGTVPTYSSKHYDLYRTGSALDADPAMPAGPMLVLMGGGADVDDAFRAMIAKARGKGGARVDVVVIRASGEDGYNDYLHAMDGVDSVETLVIKSRTGAADPEVNRIVSRADVLFIAGGDQWDYISLWKGTALDATLQALAARHVPLGGTSAGLAVLGQFDFSAENGTITSSAAMGNPYDRKIALDGGFLNSLPYLSATITDSHFVARDRMGRLITFLARLIQDGAAGVGEVRGIGVDEQTAVVIEDGVATVMGNDDGLGGRTGSAYFLRPTVAAAAISPKRPLTMRSVGVDKRVAGQTFELERWPASTGYHVDVEAGQLSIWPY
jgi:cyanophycinase